MSRPIYWLVYLLAWWVGLHLSLAAATEPFQDAWRLELEGRAKALREAFDRLDQDISLITRDDLYGERLTILELRRVIKEMRQQAAQVVQAHREALDASKAYGSSLAASAPELAAAAKRFDDFLAEEPYEELREDYRLWGQSFQAIAKKYQRHARSVGPAIATVSENLRFVERTELQLARVEQLLNVLPDEEGVVEEFLLRLDGYVNSFSKLRDRLRALHGATFGLEDSGQSGPESLTPTKSKRPATSAAVASPVPRDVTTISPAALEADSTSQEAVPSTLAGYLGRWNLETGSGRASLQISWDGTAAKVRLVGRHAVLRSVEGIVVPSGSGAEIQGLTWRTRTGEKLYVGSVDLTPNDPRTLEFKSRVIAGTYRKGFRLTSQRTTFRMHRVR